MSEIHQNDEFFEFEDGAAERVRKAEAKKVEELRQARLEGKMPRKRCKRQSRVQLDTAARPPQHAHPQQGNPRASPPELFHGPNSTCYEDLLEVYVKEEDFDKEYFEE